MNILMTGAFGNIGCMVMDALIERNHSVTAFDLQTKANRKLAAKYQSKVTVAWGDINRKETIQPYISGAEVIIHLAAVLPPYTELKPDVAFQVNVGGTEALVNVIKESGTKPVLIYASSFAVFGSNQALEPPRKVSDPLIATDNYSQHKIACEKLISDLSIPWVILRLGACLDSRQRHAGKDMIRLVFDTHPDNRLEYVHPKDVATAVVNSLERQEAHRKVMLIGGGKNCQVTQFKLIDTLMGAAGIRFMKQDFGNQPFYTDWLDTEDSQRILEFQNHSFDDFREEVYQSMKFVRPIVKGMSSLVRRLFLAWLRY